VLILLGLMDVSVLPCTDKWWKYKETYRTSFLILWRSGTPYWRTHLL